MSHESGTYMAPFSFLVALSTCSRTKREGEIFTAVLGRFTYEDLCTMFVWSAAVDIGDSRSSLV